MLEATGSSSSRDMVVRPRPLPGNAYALMTSDVPNATRDKELAADLVPKPGSREIALYTV